jgi:hypothetical protein
MLATLLVAGVAHAGEPSEPVPGATPAPGVDSAPAKGPWRALVGAAWTPSGTGALALQSTGSLSGTLAGELDGVLVPSMRAYAGGRRGRTSWIGELSWVQVDVTRATVDGDTSRRSVGAVRAGGELRRDLLGSVDRGVVFSGHAGLHANVPLVTLTDSTWTEAEVLDASDTVADLRRRVGGAGFAIGGGARVPLLRERLAGPVEGGAPALSLGVRAGLGVHARAGATTEDGSAVVTVLPEAALTLEWETR